MAINAEIFEANQRLLWGLCYRMTGNAADADEIVQETFVRALQHPSLDTSEPVKPWLIRVAINLSRDLLRRRKRRNYVGEWLPSPVLTDELESLPSYEPPAPDEDSPLVRYEMLESVSFAFLLALEALKPMQRAVLLLRDVFDYSVEETAEALSISDANVKVILHRARKQMREYDKERARKPANLSERTRQALERFLFFLNTHNHGGLEELLTADAISLTDGGGEVAAALNPIYGRKNIIRLVTKLAENKYGETRTHFTTLNGLPAVIVETGFIKPKLATRFTIQCEIDEQDHITRFYHVLAPSKLQTVESGKVM
jgi:RNA polymerase sigma-70 factor (ECF subfamily)